MPQERYDIMDLPEYSNVLKEAEQVIRQCFQQFKLEEVFLSFNGGKDCTVLLDMTIQVLLEQYTRKDVEQNLKVIYIRTSDPFKEIEDFVREIEAHYGIKLSVAEGEMKATLQRLLDRDLQLKACMMGTRRTDPYSEDLNFMQKTDPNWPQVIRVSPLLNWSYHQIWTYILRRKVPYCCLYDKGYTSIGSTNNTWPNPALAYKDNNGGIAYHPAWCLSDAGLERAGRNSAQKSAVNGHINGENGHCNSTQINCNST